MIAVHQPRSIQWKGVARFATGLLFGACSHGAHAQTPSPETPWSLQARLGRTQYIATEYAAQGNRLNQESGPLLARGITLLHARDPLQWRIALDQASNSVGYDGQTQAGVPLNSQARIRLTHLETDLSWRFYQRGPVEWSGLAGAAWQQIDRLIAATPPAPPALPTGSQALQETMDTWILFGGLRTGFAPVDGSPLRLQAEWQVRTQLHNRIKVDSLGVFDPLVLIPARTTGWRVQASGSYDLSPDLQIGLEWRREKFAPGPSQPVAAMKNGLPVASVQYPGSRQYQSRTVIFLNWQF